MQLKLYIQPMIIMMLFVLTAWMSCTPDLTKPIPGKSPVSEIRSLPAVNPFPGADTQQIKNLMAEMTLEEKVGQLVIWEPDFQKIETRQTAGDLIKMGRVGGLLPPEMELAEYLFWKDSLERCAAIPLLVGTRQPVSLHGQFQNLPDFPAPLSIDAIGDQELRDFLTEEYFQQLKTLGIHFAYQQILPVDKGLKQANYLSPDESKIRLDRFAEEQVLVFANPLSASAIELNDSIRLAEQYELYRFISSGLPGLVLDNSIYQDDQMKNQLPRFLNQFITDKLGLPGLP